MKLGHMKVMTYYMSPVAEMGQYFTIKALHIRITSICLRKALSINIISDELNFMFFYKTASQIRTKDCSRNNINHVEYCWVVEAPTRR